MTKKADERTIGLKTFFVAPDIAMISESFMESAYMNGYESYLIVDDAYVDLKTKVQTLIRNFKELILFFSVDKGGNFQQWLDYIGELHEKYGELVRIGVMYKNLNSDAANLKLKEAFLMNIGITAGCIPLHFSTPKNQALLLDVLKANEAEGRRKSIRMICSDKYRLNLIEQGRQYDGVLIDISISHFSCYLEGDQPPVEVGSRLDKIQLKLAGTICMVSAVLALKRLLDNKIVYIFIFKDAKDRDGLDDMTKFKVNSLISKHFQEDMADFLQSRYPTQ